MNFFRDIERRIDQRLRNLFEAEPAPGQGRELVEIQKLILERVDDRIQMLPRARRALPFNQIAIRIPVPDSERMAAFETVFVADNALQEEVLEHLRQESVEFPEDIRISVTLFETAETAEPSLVFSRSAKPEEPPATQELRTVQLILPSGHSMEIRKAWITLGRIGDVLDERRRLVRRNDVVVEGETVSRAHAHITFADGEFRLFDDGSSYGTSASHGGRLIDVPHVGARGLRLESGDEIYLGQVRIGFTIL